MGLWQCQKSIKKPSPAVAGRRAPSLIQTKLDIERSLSEVENAQDMDSLEAGFVENAASYSERKGVTYTAWREFGVPAKVLRSAGIKETRRR
jgi:hypothetical protein